VDGESLTLKMRLPHKRPGPLWNMMGPERFCLAGEHMEKLDPSAVAEARTSGARAARHELNIPLRYRLEGQENWAIG